MVEQKPRKAMGNSASYQRHFLYWGAVLLLLIPPSNHVNGWNIPYFGGEKGPAVPDSLADDPGVRMDSVPNTADSADPLFGGANGFQRLSTVAAPMFGPIDAPHLRYIPSYFSNQIPTSVKQFVPSLLSTFHSTRLKVYQLLWYKPPVGIIGAWSFLRLLEKLYEVFSPPPPATGEEALADAEGKLRGAMTSIMPNGASSMLSPWGSIGKLYTANVQKRQIQKRRRTRRRKVRKGRSLDLDQGDRSYDNFGGIETVRVRACQEALRSALVVTSQGVESSSLDDKGKGPTLFGHKRKNEDVKTVLDDETCSEYANDIEIAIGALQLSCPPRGSREYLVEQSAEALSALSKYITPSNENKITNPAASINEQNMQLLLKHSSKLIELRTLDALLRTLRDRHLLVAARLRRTRDYWKWHVKLSGGMLGRIVLKLRQEAMKVVPWMGDDFRDRNQREFELISCTWERELEWLGKVERLLLERPAEMEVGDLLSVVGNSKQKQISWWNSFANNEVETNVTSTPSLTSSTQLFLQAKNRMWIRQTEEWSKTAREAIKDSLDETISSSFTPIKESDESTEGDGQMETPSILYAESRFLEKWANYDDNTSGAYSWQTVLSLVDYAASTKRAGERTHLFQLSSITSQIKRYDFLGIPSSALLLVAANSLHDKVIAPHKQEIVDFVRQIFSAVWGVVVFRFYTPMKDIVLDLLNRRPRMVDPFALLNEQTSLDNMLKNLGAGDGTRANRAVALAAASRMYENEVAGGAIRGIVRGNVAQLMLIQIQQLKADLLQAMDTIDTLVDANRLNVQLLASIPAVLILFFGTRALFLFWSNIRMKDFRLPQDVHAEMSDTLKKMEECLVLSNYQLDATVPKTVTEGTDSPIVKADACLRPKEMGQLLLLLHSYLNLLDYMSPPFPSKQCDSIHQSTQKLLMQGQMTTARQLELLKVIQSKHADLLKSL